MNVIPLEVISQPQRQEYSWETTVNFDAPAELRTNATLSNRTVHNTRRADCYLHTSTGSDVQLQPNALPRAPKLSLVIKLNIRSKTVMECMTLACNGKVVPVLN
jgi:hypothetical protein